MYVLGIKSGQAKAREVGSAFATHFLCLRGQAKSCDFATLLTAFGGEM